MNASCLEMPSRPQSFAGSPGDKRRYAAPLSAWWASLRDALTPAAADAGIDGEYGQGLFLLDIDGVN